MESNFKKVALDFIRAFSCICIIITHFGYYSVCHAINHIGLVFTSIFSYIFILLSGFTLYYNHSSIPEIKSFYFARFKILYPMFYISYFIFFFIKVIEMKKFFWGGHWYRGIFSFFALDGYMSYTNSTYYLVGEWFLGAIIICYILYPFLIKILNSKKVVFRNIFFCILFLGMASSFLFYDKFFKIYPKQNIFTVLFVFYIGMIFSKIDISKYFKQKKLYLLLVFLSFILIFTKILNVYGIYKINSMVYEFRDVAIGVFLFIFLYFLGQKIMKSIAFRKILTFLSGINYAIFLLQHKIILYFNSYINSENFITTSIVFFNTLTVIIIFSYFLKVITKATVRDIENLMQSI